MKASGALLYVLWAWLFAALGVALAVLGPALPELRGEFGVSLAGAGLLFSLHSAGYLLGVLVAGPLADARGRKLITGAGVVLLAGGMVLGAVSPGWALLLTSMVVAGAGFALVDVGLNAAIGDAVAGTGHRAAAMNLLHTAFPLGTLVAPVVLALAWRAGLGWRAAFVTSSLFTGLALTAFAARQPVWPRASEAPPAAAGAAIGGARGSRDAPGHVAGAGGLSLLRLGSVLRLLREPPLRRLAAIQGLYVGVEVGIAGWLATYLIEGLGADADTGALATAAYWGGFLVGRPVMAWVMYRLGPLRILPWLFVAGIVAGCAGAVASSVMMAAIAYALLGAAICGIFPTVMALALEGRTGDAGAVAALITAAAALGSLTWPWLLGAIAQAAGLRLAMATAAAPLLVILLIDLSSRLSSRAGLQGPRRTSYPAHPSAGASTPRL